MILWFEPFWPSVVFLPSAVEAWITSGFFFDFGATDIVCYNFARWAIPTSFSQLKIKLESPNFIFAIEHKVGVSRDDPARVFQDIKFHGFLRRPKKQISVVHNMSFF